MYRTHRTLLTFLLAVAAPLLAQDFDPLAGVVRNNFPDAWRMGVVCNYDHSREAVDRLASSLGEGYRVVVVDLRHPDFVGAAYSTLLREKPHVMVLMPKDPIVRDGSAFATYLAKSFAPGIPTLGTRPVALENGAYLAVGPETGGDILMQGYRITKPEFVPPPKEGRTGPAKIQVLGAGM